MHPCIAGEENMLNWVLKGGPRYLWSQGPVGVTLSTAAGACEVRGAMLSTIGRFVTGSGMTNQFKFVDVQIPIQLALKTASAEFPVSCCFESAAHLQCHTTVAARRLLCLASEMCC